MRARSSEPRPRDRLRLLGVLLAGLAAVWLGIAYFTFSTEVGQPASPEGEVVWAFDLKAYLGAAQRISETRSPYDQALVSDDFSSGPAGLYYYSPVLAVSLLPMAEVPLDASSTWWFAIHVLGLVAACALMPVPVALRLFAFAIAGFSYAVVRDVALGNVSVLLLLPMVMAWRWLDRPLGSVGLGLGIALRPSLGLLWVWQVLRRRWLAATWTIGTGLALVLLTLPFVDLDSYRDYLAVLGNIQAPTNEGVPSGGWQNLHLGEIVRSLGAGDPGVTLAQAASIAAGIGAMLLSLRRDREVSFMVTLMASLVVVPLLWDHYLAMVLLPAAFLAARWHPLTALLPLLSWIPGLAFGTVVAAMLLPFLVSDQDADAAEPGAERLVDAGVTA